MDESLTSRAVPLVTVITAARMAVATFMQGQTDSVVALELRI